VARGKVQLVQALLDGDLQPSDNLAHLISRCLLCGACQEACPGDVEVTEIILRARAELVRSLSLEGAEEASPIPSVSRWRRYLGAMRSSPGNPLPAILNLLSKVDGRGLPVVSPKPLSSQAEMAKGPKARMRVGYLPGCAQSIYPHVGKAVLEVLEKNRIQAIFPEEPLCCGAPFLEAGDFDAARKLAQANISAFAEEDVEAIVVSCSAGLRALQRDYENLLGLQGFGVPVYDIGEFLGRIFSTHKKFSPLPVKVTYMNARGSEERGNWDRKILAEIPELELVEMEKSEGRCGESLFFSALHPELFRKMMDKRLEAVAETGATVVITNSPICMWQLEGALQDRGGPVKVMHTAEVMAAAYEGGRAPAAEAQPGVAQRKKS
jgi:Fe-S oxidoreductase